MLSNTLGLKQDLNGLKRAGFIVAGVLVGLFIVVACLVVTDVVDPLDIKITSNLAKYHAPWIDSFMRFFTYVGSFPAIVVLIVAVSALLYKARHKIEAKYFLVSATASQIINPILKIIFGRDRPSIFDKVTIPDSLSFPSGHSFSAAAVFGLLFFVLAIVLPAYKKFLTALGVVFPLLIAFSRVYLGAHWFSDVIGGLLLGFSLSISTIALIQMQKES